MKNQNIKDSFLEQTQEIDINIPDSIDFRLDILRLTFTIEHKLEKILSLTLGSRIKLAVFEELVEKKEEFKEFINIVNSMKQTEKIISKNNKLGDYFNLKTFLTHCTFGLLIKLLKLFKYEIISEMFEDWLEKIEWRVIVNWLMFVKDIRNLLAHRSLINPNTFFSKLSTPKMPRRTNYFSKLSEESRRKMVLIFFLKEESKTVKISKLINKYLGTFSI